MLEDETDGEVDVGGVNIGLPGAGYLWGFLAILALPAAFAAFISVRFFYNYYVRKQG